MTYLDSKIDDAPGKSVVTQFPESLVLGFRAEGTKCLNNIFTLFTPALTVSRVVPGVVLKLREASFFVTLYIRLRRVGVVTIGKPSFTSFNSGLL